MSKIPPSSPYTVMYTLRHLTRNTLLLPLLILIVCMTTDEASAAATAALAKEDPRGAATQDDQEFDDVAPYVFPEFPYKETVSNEKQWLEHESACGQAPGCLLLEGLQHTRCVRECIAPACYNLLYRPDELEEGEIDVRLNSFKGCFLKKVVKARRP